MSGCAPLTILHPLDGHDRRRGAVRRDRRAVGQRQVHAARPDRGSRRADVGLGRRSTAWTSRSSARTRWRGCAARRSASCSSSSTSFRRSRRTRTSPCRWRSRGARDARRAGRRRCWTKSGSPGAPITTRRSSRAASSSGSRLRARSPTIRRSCSPTSRPATSTAPTAGTSWSCCSTSTARAARRSCSSRTTPSWRRWPMRGWCCATAAS